MHRNASVLKPLLQLFKSTDEARWEIIVEIFNQFQEICDTKL